MKTRNTILAGLAALMAAPGLWAQTGGTSMAAPASKVAVINLQAAIVGTAEGKQDSTILRAQFAPRQTEIQNLQKQLEDIQRQAQNGQNTLSDEAKANLSQQYSVLNRRLQRENQDFTDDFNDAQQVAINKIGQKMMAVLDKFAKANGYGVVIDDSPTQQSNPVVYVANQVDITQQIIKLYDDANPVKTAAPPAAKPAPVSKPGARN